MDVELIAASVTTALAPFVPFLVEATKEGGRKLAEVISERGGEATWNRAQRLWEKIKPYLENDQKIKGTTLMVSAEPDNETSQKMLATVLAARLKENPHLAQELLNLLGGQEVVQQVLADRKSWVSDVKQQIVASGKQTIKADRNSRIKGVKQLKK